MIFIVTLKSNVKKVKWAVRRAVGDALEKSCQIMVRKIKANLNTPWPPASSPGKFPHKRTGNLRDNIDYWLNRKTLEAKIGPTVDATYGLYLEFGTTKMAARPFLGPTQRQLRKQLGKIMADATARAFRRHYKK